ncbi:MAG TPA: TonB-dependent receptor, partial [Candidatus Limnocylindria bacterium]|nr:TonB-dependent receptor [Candidatus Limnocylindria bacterium]
APPADGAPAPAPNTAAPESASTDADVTKIEEIVVTAQKREQKLQDVPVAVTAITTDQIESRGIDNLSDLNAVAPGLQISKTPSNSTISQITIRGVSQINPAIYWDPAVGVYVDGVYIGKSQGSIFDIVDLARVEVLRGPQGTLYGRNTLAGAINLVTAKPSGTLAGSGSVELGRWEGFVTKASLDMPQAGPLRVSLGWRMEHRDGWVDETTDNPVDEFGDRAQNAVRLAADLDVTDAITAAYRFDWSDVDQSNSYLQLTRLDPGGTVSLLFPSIGDYVFTDRRREADVNSESYEHARVSGHSLTFDWQAAEGLKLRSISGYRTLEWNDSLDLDGSPNLVAFTQRFTDYDQFSQDLQAIGSVGDLDVVAGLYWFTDDGDTNNPQTFLGGLARFDSRYGTETDAKSAYGQLDWHVLEPLTVSAGLRYTREKKELDRVLGCNSPAQQCVVLPPAEFDYRIPEDTHASKTFSATTPMASVAWQLGESVNTYARYAEGFKSGGFNGEFSDTTQDSAANVAETKRPFKPERQKTYEVGVKSTWLDGHALLNVAAYHSDARDLQASIFLGSGAAATIVRNVGEATLQGVEVEAAWVPFDGTRLSVNYAYLDAEYDKFIDGEGVDRADDRAVVHAPEHSVNVVLDAELARFGFGTVRGIADYAWTDAFYSYPYQLSGADDTAQVAADSAIPSTGILNLRLALTK